jgi:hypothetical protein
MDFMEDLSNLPDRKKGVFIVFEDDKLLAQTGKTHMFWGHILHFDLNGINRCQYDRIFSWVKLNVQCNSQTKATWERIRSLFNQFLEGCADEK